MTKRPIHQREYAVGGIGLRVRSDLPITDRTFAPKFKGFEVQRQRRIDARVNLHFTLPEVDRFTQGSLVYKRTPWAIYRDRTGWSYIGISRIKGCRPHLIARFNKGHTAGDIHVPDDTAWRKGGLQSLTMFPTDQILLARLLADRRGVMLHSAGMILGKDGLLFLGHSSAGKSTICAMFAKHAGILCDDRNIVRQHGNGFKLYGTWSHGTFARVSSGSAPLKALFLLKQSRHNRITRITNKGEALKRLLPLVVKPLVTADWWEQTLDTLDRLVARVPAYELEFDKSGQIMTEVISLSDTDSH